MAAAGVNRVSLGVQSFVDAEARASGRLHTRAIIEEDLLHLRAAGIANLNVDLIAGLAGQTFASWDESLAALIDAGVPHASVYMLEVDEDSRLGRELLGGGARYYAQAVPTDDAIARMYERAIERLGAAGLAQYEISNFARPRFTSRHNLRYWQRRPYLGVGLDASSMLRATGFVSGHDLSRAEAAEQSVGALAPAGNFVLRSTTTDDLGAYLAGTESAETAWLSPDRQHEEAWFLGLRLNAGVGPAALEAEFGGARVDPAQAVAIRLEQDGLLAIDRGTVRLTAQGRLLSNDVFQEFLGLERESALNRC
jgi:oxygen-independent coproporphyrinogen-3 oxidase